jgi:hypothetical protein
MIELHICIELKQKSEDEYELVAVRYTKMGCVFLIWLSREEFSSQIIIYALDQDVFLRFSLGSLLLQEWVINMKKLYIFELKDEVFSCPYYFVGNLRKER